MTLLRLATVEAPAVSANAAKYQSSGIIMAPASLLVGPDGKPIPRQTQRLMWTSDAWKGQLRRHGMFADLNRMERAQSKRDRKKQARKAVLA